MKRGSLSDKTSLNTAINPITLHFLDRDLERRYSLHYYHSNETFFRLFYMLCLLTTTSIGLAEKLLFSPETFARIVIFRYFIAVPLLLLGSYFVFSKRLASFREVHHQKLYIGLFLSGLGPCIFIGMEIIKIDNALNILYGGLVLMFGFIFVFFISRMWFLHATLFSGFFLVISSVFVSYLSSFTLFGYVTFYVFTLGGYVSCVFGSYQMERHIRSHFMSMELLKVEQEKSEKLLLNILPSEFAERLKQKEEYIAESFDNVSVLFADIVGFTPLSEKLEPTELVQLLNKIFSEFDEICESEKVEKIKTIGDAYMAATGVPVPQSDHAERIARAALRILHVIQSYSHQNEHFELQVRVGIHSGNVVAGVIGRKKFIYDLWGDTVNLASRMESHGYEGKIQVSSQTAALLADNFELKERGEIPIKGKGKLKTFWLLSEAE